MDTLSTMYHLENSLKTDLYELTMAAGYFHNSVDLIGTFELSCRTMPENRSFIVACGLEQLVDYVLNLRFLDEDIEFLRTRPAFKTVNPNFFDYLKEFKFSGDLWAMPEGEIFFANEPVIQIEAPIIEAQILETYLLSVMNIESLVATKAVRVIQAACSDGIKRGVVDFGSRRAHGPEAAILAARAAYIAGCMGTSNVYAGKKFDIPIFGTMSHSWVEAFNTEEESFRKYYEAFPENTILLVDTYDTIKAIKMITKLELNIKGIRLDSGDLKVLSRQARKILDQADLSHIKIIASGNLNEYKILELVEGKSPIDLFGVGTDMVTSRDWPALDLTYKLVQTKDQDADIKFKAKRSPMKQTIPGRKQVYRKYTQKGLLDKDIVGLFSEDAPAEAQPLLQPVIEKGQLKRPLPTIDTIRSYFQERLTRLPPSCFHLHSKPLLKAECSKKISKLKT